MTARLALAALLLAAAGCATTGEIDTSVERPPSIASELARLEAGPACADDWAIPEWAAAQRRGSLAVGERCPPVWPKILQKASMNAACRSMFDVDGEGVPQNIVSRCNIFGGYGQYREEWRELAKALFAASTTRSVSLYRVTPLDPTQPMKPQQDVTIATHFTWEGETPSVPVPEPFERRTSVAQQGDAGAN